MKAYDVKLNGKTVTGVGADAKGAVKSVLPAGFVGTVSANRPYGSEWKRFQVDSAGRVREIASYGK
jgi:hypothetical protein